MNLVTHWQKRWPGVHVEDKAVALALHFRQAPEAGPVLGAALEGLDLGAAWQIIAGHCVYELKSTALSKGSALRSLMQTPAFAGRRPIFIGDDRTDLDGIAAAIELNGAGIVVGGLNTDLAEEWRLPDPPAVRDWLRGLLAG
jgi:trehalose 6-phosphate phosphatase